MRILLVSNRLPVTVNVQGGQVSITPSSGGLATGLRGPHEKSGGLWIGWPGDVSELSPAQRKELDQRLMDVHTIPLYLSDEEHNRYYQGFANGVLWPLFHYLLDKVALESRDFEMYKSVNERFADTVAMHYKSGDLIWVHDYQLMLLPSLLRERLPDARIGFFLHIPFPSSEVFRILPWRKEVLEGLLGADLIGFHTLAYMRHFTGTLLRVSGIETQVDHLAYRGRQIQLGAFPMGIDAADYAAMADSKDIGAAANTIRKEAGERKILLGVERLDYTKGLPRRLLAFERLLERRQDLRDKVRFLQVAVPSRGGIDSYDTLRRQVDELLGHINGRFGTTSFVPVHYLYRSFSQQELVAMYRAADVMVVTPLRDGMNLVAKEFCAARTDEDGVLILSEFAGAAAEFGEALRVNPYDIEQVAAAYEQALEMGEDERRNRMRGLRQRVADYDVHRWSRSFLDTLEASHDGEPSFSRSFTPVAAIDVLVAEIRESGKLDLLLDYDGTLMPFAAFPVLAAPDKDLSELLTGLIRRAGTSIHILSGRTRDDLERWFGHLPIGLYAEHGLWMRPADQREWSLITELTVEWKEKVHAVMRQFVWRTPGSFIEDKTASVAWHYRNAEPEFASLQANELRLHLMTVLSNFPVEVLQGEKVIEVRMHGVNKGAAVRRILNSGATDTVVAMGDDRTDEDMFAALPKGSYSIHVGPNPTLADYSLVDTWAARKFLRRLLEPVARSVTSVDHPGLQYHSDNNLVGDCRV